VKIALGQINPTIGDFEGNLALAETALGQAERGGADLLVLPELSISGYPPRDLLERPAFIEAAGRALAALARRVGRTAVIAGFPERLEGGTRGLANSARSWPMVRSSPSTASRSCPPTTSSTSGATSSRPPRWPAPICAAGAWASRCARTSGTTPTSGPSACTARIPSRSWWRAAPRSSSTSPASPYTIDKRHLRPRMLASTARRWRRPLVFVNQVGGQDDLVFDGASLVLDERGEVIARGAEHASDLLFVDLESRRGDLRVWPASDARSALEALTAGHARLRPPLRLRQRARRPVGRHRLGGGGLRRRPRAGRGQRARRGHALALLVGALAQRRRRAGPQPGHHHREIPIERVFSAYLETLAPVFAGRAPTPPRRTCRRACAAPCSCRCRTSSTTSSSPPGTRASSAPATAPFTATCAAAWP
jgi:predicted amidohydrolase